MKQESDSRRVVRDVMTPNPASVSEKDCTRLTGIRVATSYVP